jgi:hypothetical protein
MNAITLRIAFAMAFGLVALVGGLILEAIGVGCPPWLPPLIGAAAGYAYGHAEANGLNGHRNTPSG